MIFGVAIALLFITQGLIRLSRFVIWLFQWRRCQNWPRTTGIVIRSSLKSMLVPRGGRKSLNLDGSARLMTAFSPRIVYEYHINGETFQSKQLFLGENFPLAFSMADEFVEKFPKGKKVIVFYDPERPGFSILERGRTKELFGNLGGALLLLIFGFGFLIQATQM
jgi:hypothetical protein